MSCFNDLLFAVRSGDARLSWRSEAKGAMLQGLLQRLSASSSRVMGNHPSDLRSDKRGLHWTNGPGKALADPPDFLLKLAKVNVKKKCVALKGNDLCIVCSSYRDSMLMRQLPRCCLLKAMKVLVTKSLAEDNLDGITERIFIKYVCKANQSFGKRLFQYFIVHGNEESQAKENQQTEKESIKELMSKEVFLSSSNYLLGLMTDPHQLEFYIKIFAKDKEKIDKMDVYELVLTAYHISRDAYHKCRLPDDILMAVVNAAMHGKESVNTKYLHSWVCQHCPRLVMWLHRYITHTLTVGHRTMQDNADDKEDDRETPILDCASTSSCVSLHPALMWLLTCTLPDIYIKQQKMKNLPASNSLLLDPHVFIDRMISAVSPTHWIPLYNSENHGLSINRFQHHVFGYHGPTLMFLMAEGGNMFCLASDLEWRDSQHFWGQEHCLCIHLTPEYKIIESGAKMMYFNVTSRGYPTGFQVGRDCTDRALTLDLNLSLVMYRKIPFKLHSIEVWGCGTSEAKEAQIELKKHEVKDTENRRKVKINSADWVDNPDRYLIELAGTRPSYAQYDKPVPGGASEGAQ